MSNLILLDSGPLGMVTNPKASSIEAQAKLEEIKENEVIVATTNVGHLSLFVDAREWRKI